MINFGTQFFIICLVFIFYIFHYFYVLKSTSILNIGFWIVLSTFIYTVFPIINYYFGDFSFGVLSDSRLFKANISDYEVSDLYSYYLVYFISITAFILLFRFTKIPTTLKVAYPKDLFKHIIILYALLRLVLFFFSVFYKIDFERSQHVSSAIELNQQAYSNAPYFIIQISSKLSGIFSITKIALLVIMTLNYQKFRKYIILFITIEFIFLLINQGSRTQLFNLLFIYFLIYQHFISSVKLAKLLFFSSIFLILFLFLGYYRGLDPSSATQFDLKTLTSIIFSVNNEFQVLFATSFEVLELVKSKLHFPWILYFNDIVTVFPPSQLLPFQKIEAANWYLVNQGYKDSGVGYMWGVISQALIGFGYYELVFRSLLLTFLAKNLHAKLSKNSINFYQLLLYILLCLKAYYTFRNTTLGFIPFVVYEFIPFVVLIGILDLIINSKINLKNYFR